MIYVTLDGIIRNHLAKRGYSLHWYIDAAVAAKECLRILVTDDLRITNTKLIPVNDYNAIDLPDDYMDYVRVGVRVGQSVRPLVESDKINALLDRDSEFNPVQYSDNTDQANQTVYYGYTFPFYWHSSGGNEYGENTGRLFGYGAGIDGDTFRVVKERNQIQITENLEADFIVLEYISDGQNIDTATRIPSEAYETIDQYILWMHKEHNRTYSEYERARAQQNYVDERIRLRARMSNLTIEVMKRIAQRASYAAPKSA